MSIEDTNVDIKTKLSQAVVHAEKCRRLLFEASLLTKGSDYCDEYVCKLRDRADKFYYKLNTEVW